MLNIKNQILFLAPILEDAAVRRRISMFRTGGANVTVMGFRRSAQTISTIDDCSAVDLGRSFNAKFLQRIGLVILSLSRLRKYRDVFRSTDVIVARNLEMLVLACFGRWRYARGAKLVYEVLDIHRLLLNKGSVGLLLRWLEGQLTRNVSVVLTSSPGFTQHYFKTVSRVRAPTYLIENKVSGWAQVFNPLGNRTPGPPWVIGWFGIIRCVKSMDALKKLVTESKGTVRLVIRGKPAENIFGDFAAQLVNIPNIEFLGPYKNPEDLESIYRDIHFVWAIDHFEEGQNSNWLLPNRLYEGGAFGAVPIGENNVQIGRFLSDLNVGVKVNSIFSSELFEFFRTLTPEQFGKLETALQNVSRKVWIADAESCRSTVEMLLQRSI